MKHIVNALILLFTVCIATLMWTDSINMGFYFILIAIDYGIILLLNADFRKALKRKFKKNKTFGSGDKVYGEIHLDSLKEDIEKIEPIAFEYFVGDLFARLGYKTKVTDPAKDFGGDVIARKGKDTTIIQVKHRDSSDWKVNNEAVQQAVSAMPVYKANQSMVVTNGTFTEHAYKQANFSHTLMIDGEQLFNLVRQVILQDKDNKPNEAQKKTTEVDKVQSGGVDPLEDTIDEMVVIKVLDEITNNLASQITLEDMLEMKLDQVLKETTTAQVEEEDSKGKGIQTDASNS